MFINIKTEEEFFALFNNARKDKTVAHFLIANTYDEKYNILVKTYNPRRTKLVYFIDLFELPSITAQLGITKAPTLISVLKGKESRLDITHAIRHRLNDIR